MVYWFNDVYENIIVGAYILILLFHYYYISHFAQRSVVTNTVVEYKIVFVYIPVLP